MPLQINLSGLPLNLIQALRVSHALMEADGLEVYVPKDESPKFTFLKKYFDFNFKSGELGASLAGLIEIDHEGPQVRVGELSRPLVFPQGIFNRCRQMWSEEREVRIFFSGLMTDQRLEALSAWGERWYPEKKMDWGSLKRIKRSRLQKILGRRPKAPTITAVSDDISIWSSEKGRHFPVKAWDEEYFRMLSKAQFVLCPNGDFIWTYRFFESAMCGAMPIIEDECTHYDGFHFFRMGDDPKTFIWDQNKAFENFERCRTLLTIPKEDFTAELDRQISLAKP
ncbi:MAG: hypothetical protein C0608_10520 [Deltaproteobacteria bacterium]|nr:MAG: hypothetical protein C0608_10520 [Deltaproteobacteria bacterium]